MSRTPRVTSLSHKAGFLIGANLIKYAVGFTLPMLMVRLLTKNDYGTYQQLLLVNSMALGLLTLGLPSSIYYFYNRVDAARRSALVVQTLALLGFAGLVATIGIALGSSFIAARTSNPALADLLPLYALAIGLMLAGEHFTSFMVAQDRYASAVGFETFETVVRVLSLMLPVALGFGMRGLVVAAVVYALLRLVVRTFWLTGTGAHRVRPLGRGLETFFGEQLAYSVPLWMTSIVGVAGGMLDRAIVAASFTPVDFAVYSVGAFAVPLDVIFQASVADVLRASLPPLIQRDDLREVARLLREAVRKLALIMLPSFVFLFGFAQEFVTLLFTNQYADSVRVFRIYACGIPLFMFVLSLVPQVFGRTRINMNIVIVVTAFHVALSFTLLKFLGFYGPAVSGVVTSYVSTAIYLRVATRLTRASLAELLPLPEIARTLACAGFAYAVAWLPGAVSSHKIVAMLVHAGVFSAVFFGVGFAARLFSAQDRRMARRFAEKLRLLRPA
jgi:O-antigen/teichoic acid export membrane protein